MHHRYPQKPTSPYRRVHLRTPFPLRILILDALLVLPVSLCLSAPRLLDLASHTSPLVLVSDILDPARQLVSRILTSALNPPPTCVGVGSLFDQGLASLLVSAASLRAVPVVGAGL